MSQGTLTKIDKFSSALQRENSYFSDTFCVMRRVFEVVSVP